MIEAGMDDMEGVNGEEAVEVDGSEDVATRVTCKMRRLVRLGTWLDFLMNLEGVGVDQYTKPRAELCTNYDSSHDEAWGLISSNQ